MTTDKKDARFTTIVFRKENEVAFMAQHGATAIALSGLSLFCLNGGSRGLFGLHNVINFFSLTCLAIGPLLRCKGRAGSVNFLQKKRKNLNEKIF